MSSTELDLSCNPLILGDEAKLKYFKHLTKLNLRGSKLKSVDFIENMPNLVEFGFGYLSFTSSTQNMILQSLSTASEIVDLQIVGLDSYDISFLTQMGKLQKLEMSFSNINLEMAKTISSISSLTELDLSYSIISSMQNLKNLVNLKVLYLNNTSITDVNDILIFSNLSELHLCDTKISDISKPALLENLKTVYVSKSQYKTLEIEYLRSCGISVVEI